MTTFVRAINWSRLSRGPIWWTWGDSSVPDALIYCVPSGNCWINEAQRSTAPWRRSWVITCQCCPSPSTAQAHSDMGKITLVPINTYGMCGYYRVCGKTSELLLERCSNSYRMSETIFSISSRFSTTNSGFSAANLSLSYEPVATAIHWVPAVFAVTTSKGESPMITNWLGGIPISNFCLIWVCATPTKSERRIAISPNAPKLK